jgi:hypothetical protein
MHLTNEEAQRLVGNVFLLILCAWLVGFWMGERSERKFRDEIDRIKEGEADDK